MNKSKDKLIAQQWAHSVLSLNRYAILDTETTGLRSTDEVCQIGILTESEEYQTLVRPTVPIGKGAFDVHGISDSDVKNAPTFDQKNGIQAPSFYDGFFLPSKLLIYSLNTSVWLRPVASQ